MHVPRGANALLTAMLLLLLGGLGVLATLQYRWIDRVSDAERQQMRANLDFAAHRFIDSFEAELQTAFESFAAPDDDLAARYEAWKRRAAHPALVEAVYVIEDGTLQRLEHGQLAAAPWPERFASLRERLGGFRGPAPGPFLSDGLGLLIRRPRGGPVPPPFAPEHLVLLQLSPDTLTRAILPALVQRHFSTGAGEVDVAIASRHTLFYRSDAGWPDERHPPDLDVPFLPLGPRRVPPGPGPRRAGPPPPLRDAMHDPLHLLVRRHDGGVDAAIAAARTRNLALSFGVLLILAATIALLVALLRRADRLRAQQTEFVAAISHELNTPVAALRSAGENLRDGIVLDGDRVRHYGATIVGEASRLGTMLGQVLEYAGMQSRRERPPDAVDAGSVVEEAVAQCRWLVEGTPIHISTVIEGGLPRVQGDAKALTSAVQNLIANAIRYGGSGNWVGVRASSQGHGIAITVEDRGPGIDSRDLPHLFEPFYRGRNVRSAKGTTRGAGLGLSIVHRIVHEHGGSIEVARRKPNEGAAFTIHLPVAVAHA